MQQKESNMAQPRRMRTSSFHLTIGILINFSLLFNLERGLVCRKLYPLVQNAPLKCFNYFVQSAVNARLQGDENSNSKVVAEFLKLPAEKSWLSGKGSQSTHCDEMIEQRKNHRLVTSKMVKQLNHFTDQLSEVEFVKPESEHRDSSFVEFSILQYVKLQKLELYYNFLKRFFDCN